MDRTKILVVDDNPMIRKGLSVRLRANGYEVSFAEDAISATAALAKQKPDLVILDLGRHGAIAQKRPSGEHPGDCADRPRFGW